MPTFVADEVVTATKLNEGTARDWTTWTPAYTNLTTGSAVVVARYMSLGQKTVSCYFSWTFGSGSAVGGGPTISLPVQASASYPDFATIGPAVLRDVGGAVYMAATRFDSTNRTRINLVYGSVSGAIGTVHAGLTSTTPFTWAAGDYMQFSATYETV